MRPPQTTVLLPLEPEASTVKRTISSEYRESLRKFFGRIEPVISIP